MQRITRMSMKTKLISIFLIVGIIPLALAGWWSSRLATQALLDAAYRQLANVREIKKIQIDTYFTERQGDMNVLVETVETFRERAFGNLKTDLMLKKQQLETYFDRLRRDVTTLADSEGVRLIYTQLKDYHDENNILPHEPYDISSSVYQRIYEREHHDLKKYADIYGYYDLFIICAEHGHVMFTTAREEDLGTNLRYGPYKESALGHLWQTVIESNDAAFEDFKPYAPSDNQYSAFMGAPIHARDGSLLGALVLQLPLERIHEIVQNRDGLGRTGETYLVGEQNGENALRSNRVVKSGSIGETKTAPYIESALQGESGTIVSTGSTGRLEVSVFEPLQLPGLTWAIIGTQDLEEVLTMKAEEKSQNFFERYLQEYGYYDLFLIHPQGEIFYSVKREADYGTNILTGPYTDSGLEQLTRQVIDSKRFGLADFEPYAPSNNEPAAFIAQPVVHNSELQLIVALQLPLKDINTIMQERSGMGNTGETYLVGADKLMRSDSYLDPEFHSVKASFADPVKGSVDTTAAQKALAGETSEEFTTDYNGTPVLSSYTFLDIGNTRWALLAEIGEAEVKAPIERLWQAIVAAGVVLGGGIFAFALVFTRGITNLLGAEPAEVAEIARRVAAGDLTVRFDGYGKHVRGLLAAMKNMVEKLNEIVEDVKGSAAAVASGSRQMSSSAEEMSQGSTEQAASSEEASSSMEEMAANIRQNTENALQTDKIAVKAAEDARVSGAAVAEAVSAMQQIAQKIAIVEDITRQTRLLSLNATIEAARAQDSGKGFAVVAAEVRALAERSQQAATEITTLATSGVTVAEKAGAMLAQLVPDIQKTAELVQEITAASREQDSGANQINMAIQQLDQVVQQNASMSEEMAATAEELSGQAEQLQKTMSFFKTTQHTLHTFNAATADTENALSDEGRRITVDEHDDQFERF